MTYFINGIVIEKKFRKPVIQTEKGTFTIKKVDLDNNKITSGAEFALYRLADENEVNTVKLKGAEGNYIKIREGVTNQNGELKFDDLRIAVFDKGYPYYLVETKNPKGYIRYEDPIELVLFKDKVEVEPENSWVDYENQIVVIKNAEYVEPIELPVTGGIGTLGFYVIGMVLIIGGYLCLAKNCFQRL